MGSRKSRHKKRAKKPRRWIFLKIAAMLCVALVMTLAIFLIRYYYIFDDIIEEKLGNRPNIAQTGIYSAPIILYPGKPISVSELIEKLRRCGYLERTPMTNARNSHYQLDDNGILTIQNDPSAPEDAGMPVELAWSNERIRSIIDAGNQTELARFSLKPEMLSNIIGKDREKRRWVSYQDFPRDLVNAVLASEDRRFFLHSGIDPIRILKALIIDIKAGDTVQGASTLTQQFVKNYFLTPERTWKRKLTDAYMAILLEQRLSKEKIFELWANEVYLGQRGSFGIIGFGEASEAFFDKGIRDLTLAEAAVLAGIISAPNRYAPLRHPERALQRRNLVLEKMADYSLISPEEYKKAKAEPLDVKPSSVINYSDAPYFVDYLQEFLNQNFSDTLLASPHCKIYTTLDMNLQQAAFESVMEGMAELDDLFAKGKRSIPPGTVQASLIAVDPRNGRILSMVGGRNYGASQYNRITQSQRQPGSIFKPFVYGAAIETVYTSAAPLTAVSTVLDEPTQFPYGDLLYEPKNYRQEYLGQVTMRQAITKSLNIATIKFAERVGFYKIAKFAHRLGLNEKIKPYPAVSIGAFEVTPLEIIRAYTAFANRGILTELNPIIKIMDEHGNTVYVPQVKTEQVLTPQVSFMITSLMQSVINNGTGAGVRLRGFSLPAAGKTGTSHDGWFAGYTPDLVCIVWVGFDDNSELNLSGAQSALPIWASFMTRAIALRPLLGEEFTVPEDVTLVEIDAITGLLATDQCPYRQDEYFIKDTEPVIPCYGDYYSHISNGTLKSIYSTPPKESPGRADKLNTPPERK